MELSPKHATRAFRRGQALSRTNGICLLASLVLIGVGLGRWGAEEVRGHLGPVFFLTFLGFFWLSVCQSLFSWFGLCIADDVVERRNLGALIALCGATVALAVIFVAGNFGEGPSYLENVFSAGLGTAAFFALWLILELSGRVSISIAEERDLGSGVRLGGFFLAIGLILGRAAAGDWHSVSATVNDFLNDGGWPAMALCLMAILVEVIVRPSRGRPAPAWITFGLFPALVYFGLAIGWVWHLGKWEGMPA